MNSTLKFDDPKQASPEPEAPTTGGKGTGHILSAFFEFEGMLGVHDCALCRLLLDNASRPNS